MQGICSKLLNHEQTISKAIIRKNWYFFQTIKMDGPYQFKNLENQGINIGTNSEPYFYEISAGQNDRKMAISSPNWAILMVFGPLRPSNMCQ